MIVECPKCKCQLEILPEHYGQNIECPNCQTGMTIPNFHDVENKRSPLRWIVPVVAVLILAAGGGFIAYRQHVQRLEAERLAAIKAAELARKAEEIRREKERKIREEEERIKLERFKLEIKAKDAVRKRKELEQQIDDDTEYMDRLRELSKKEKLSDAARIEAETLIKNLSSRYGDLGISIDNWWIRIKGIDEAEKRFAEKTKNLRMQAIKKQMDALEAQTKFQMQLMNSGNQNGNP